MTLWKCSASYRFTEYDNGKKRTEKSGKIEGHVVDVDIDHAVRRFLDQWTGDIQYGVIELKITKISEDVVW